MAEWWENVVDFIITGRNQRSELSSELKHGMSNANLLKLLFGKLYKKCL